MTIQKDISTNWDQNGKASSAQRNVVAKKDSPVLSPLSNQPMDLKLTVPNDWRRPHLQDIYKLYWNQHDQFGMLYPRPSVDEVTQYYDVADYYTHDASTEAGTTAKGQPSFANWFLLRMSWQIDNSVYIEGDWFKTHFGSKTGRVLDLGCGSGKILLRFREQGFETFGVEPDSVAREVATKRHLTVYDGTAEFIPAELDGEQFDVVIMTHVLEHCINPVQAVQNAYNFLKPGGYFVVETPNNHAEGFQSSGILWRWLDVPRHLNFFTPHSLRTICETVGLQPTETEFRGYHRQFARDWLSDEQTIWDRYNKFNHHKLALPKRGMGSDLWKLFVKTWKLSDERKYDSVRVIARKPLQ